MTMVIQNADGGQVIAKAVVPGNTSYIHAQNRAYRDIIKAGFTRTSLVVHSIFTRSKGNE